MKYKQVYSSSCTNFLQKEDVNHWAIVFESMRTTGDIHAKQEKGGVGGNQDCRETLELKTTKYIYKEHGFQ